MHNYSDVYLKLTYETATVVFLKTNGEIRVMLATRNVNTGALEHGHLGGVLAGHDGRCSIKNGNIAVIDLVIGETRSFNIDRLIDIRYHGVVDTTEKFNEVFEEFSAFKKEYEENKPQRLNIDMLDY